MNCCKVTDQLTPAPSVELAGCRPCGRRGKKVAHHTVEHLLQPEQLKSLQETQYYFSATPDCEVVYFSNETAQYFHKGDVRVRVGLKEHDDPIPLCYCFDHTVASARAEIARAGRSTVVASITAEIKAGRCACEIKNPSGRCCLGEVSQVVTGLLAEREKPSQTEFIPAVPRTSSGQN